MSGVSFLPYHDHVYQQAPYQECSKDKPVYDSEGNITTHSYDSLMKLMPERIDWSELSEYEKEDTTASSQTFACSGDVCEIVDIGA